MRLILTHEQADFDAVASLLGAYLLDSEAFPVLPRKLNRNVRSFISIYGEELPFVNAQDLPAEKIEYITLVDTQSPVSIKGIHKTTRFKIIDHHPARQDIPPEWDATYNETGSTTTILAESISEDQISLSILQATLLLLGIYEDTGSLSYASTIGRDARAAAYLIDQGANLQIVVNFLNPPLSMEQVLFYDRLSSNAKIHYINGNRIVITSGDLCDFNEEISTLAHKLRDQLDPDGLFVIASTDEGIRLIARSTTNQIDVGAITAHFGGGGHDRAAAALIRASDTEDNQASINKITQELLDILPNYVRPSITVSQIMSKSPHVLSPDTLVDEASRLMQYYGYEGYPVVEAGKVIGLLTRRSVDKALNHKLILTTASLMDANEVWVRPDDSIQHLQTCMAESGWGQVPVVDPVTGEMIGIVTRTDLLKLLSSKTTGKNRDNLEEKLISALSPDRLALIHSIAEEAVAMKSAIYIVGGFVRDLLLGRPSIDFDIVVEGDAIQIAQKVAARYGGRVTVHSRFGTAKWYLQESDIKGTDMPVFLDFITARLEFYSHPTALPTIERSSIKLDLHRRDFTINTLAIRLDGRYFGELYDFWGGQNDLREHQIRVLHSLSFIDDPTRMIRAVRFEQRFGFQIETRTLKLMHEAKGLLNNLSGDRIRHEINLIMDEQDCAKIFTRLDALGLLKSLHPSLPWSQTIHRELDESIEKTPQKNWGLVTKLKVTSDRRNMGYLLWLSNLSEKDVDPVCHRLRLSESLKKNIHSIHMITNSVPNLINAPPSKVCRRLDGISLIEIFVAYLKVDNDEARLLEKYVVSWRTKYPKTTGDDLLKLKLPPSKVYQEILHLLRDAWLDGEIKSPGEERILLERIIGNIHIGQK